MIRRICLAATFFTLLSDQSSRAEDWRAAGAEVVSLVRERFFDRGRAEAWVKENAHYAENARDRRDYVESTRRVLARLKASHTSFYTPDDPQYYGLLSIFREPLGLATVETESIGVDLTPDHFARVVLAGSPAEVGGIRRGDQIVLADGREFHPTLSLRGRAGQAVTLSVRGERDGPTRGVVVIPRMIDPRREWLEDQARGAKVVEIRGKKVAYMPFFSAAGDHHLDVLRDEITDRFADADALILDFRNGWGGANPTFVNLFNRATPILEKVGRDGTRTRYDPQWRKPLFLLINGGSRSGKEVVAFAVQKQKIGTLIGERTAGAVLGGSPFLLQDRSVLFLAVEDTLVDGERLEGRGVAPDVEVADDLPFAGGRDPQLDKAFKLAAP